MQTNLVCSTLTTRPRDVQVEEIAPQTWVLRSRTWEPLKFEVEYARQQGTTANAYLIRSDKTVLIDPPGASFTDLFLEALRQTVAPHAIDAIIVQHVNPNRIATLHQLLPLTPKAQLICSKPAAIAIQQAMPEFGQQIQVVRGGDSLPLSHDGQGSGEGPRALQFSFVPTPRWADALCSFDTHTKVLFTDKLFGAHLCGDELWDTQWKRLQPDRQHYFDCLFAPQSKQTEAALARIADYPARIYAPGHGPLIRYSLSRLTPEYWQWCAQQQQKNLSVALLYASAYGNTATMAQAIAQGLVQSGVQVQLINCEAIDPLELPAILEEADGIIMGSPTLGGHAPVQIQTALGIILASSAKRKLVGVFGSYGWSGEAVDFLAAKLKDASFKFGFKPLRIRFSPTREDLDTCRQVGDTFAKALLKSKKPRSVVRPLVTAQVDRTAQAMGRVIGSLCVITYATPEGYRSLITSWVSQASFSPPGIMLAIAHQQGLEDVAQPGSAFVLNLLQEGKNVRRHFARARVSDPSQSEIATAYTAQEGLVLQEALAYLECRTEQRVQCGDRWLVYATVECGKVLDPLGQTAIHYRASGREE
ncbi:diflavin flavoprotein [Lyngbya confervoides]|uniref:Diflavin flavoprotein n=1 Tax=Lyngbya confervoides BDU141951 TaxID=1574623 RepID=A0ABD4T656_9CYAN|nr:diflavin flavoprotein [Lyngbya confervoides]MCM1983923.1 diflavin flavoprotein [Lyngbya confervoides BDU141951]